jgi:hypothetical protein
LLIALQINPGTAERGPSRDPTRIRVIPPAVTRVGARIDRPADQAIGRSGDRAQAPREVVRALLIALQINPETAERGPSRDPRGFA